MQRPPSPLAVEQWLLDEQTPEARARTEAALDPDARARLRSDDAALRAQLMEELPPVRVAARALAGRDRARTRKRSAGMLLTFAGAAAMLAVVLVREAPTSAPLPTASTERAKGAELALQVYRSRGGIAEPLADGDPAQAGDLVQLGLRRAGLAHGVLLSIDGRGGVTLHFPGEPSASTALDPEGGEQLLPDAYELDDAPLFERFVLVAAEHPIPVGEVLDAARALAVRPARARGEPLLLSVATTQRSVLIVKPPAP